MQVSAPIASNKRADYSTINRLKDRVRSEPYNKSILGLQLVLFIAKSSALGTLNSMSSRFGITELELESGLDIMLHLN